MATTNLSDLGITRGAVERETAKAVLVRIRNGVTGFHDRDVWIPKKLITWAPPNGQTHFHDSLHVPAWFARKL